LRAKRSNPLNPLPNDFEIEVLPVRIYAFYQFDLLIARAAFDLLLTDNRIGNQRVDRLASLGFLRVCGLLRFARNDGGDARNKGDGSLYYRIITSTIIPHMSEQ
jgi:hypothetical protein